MILRQCTLVVSQCVRLPTSHHSTLPRSTRFTPRHDTSQPPHPVGVRPNINHILHKIQAGVKREPQNWAERTANLPQLISLYRKLSKERLTILVVMTSAAGFCFNPASGSLVSFAALVSGTFLCSASANACNQVMEAPFDSQMDRCKDRVMVQHLITPLHGLTFSAVAGVLGTGVLYAFTNPLTAALGFANIVLYAGAYTTLKRYTIANTWVGAIVGAIPPAMGWAAAGGTLDTGALSLCALLYLWQFPHFNSLSFNLRMDYCRAGYNMLSVLDTKKNALVSLRNTLALVPLCVAIPFTGISHCSFSSFGTVVNLCFVYYAWKFYKDPNKDTARDLFRFTLIYLPIIFGFLAIGCVYKARTATVERLHAVIPDMHTGLGLPEMCPFVGLGLPDTCPVARKSGGVCPITGKQDSIPL